MCGFVGFVAAGLPGARSAAEVLEDMAGSIQHRGPDDAGSWSAPEVGLYLGFRRLSILDLSEAGHQPMTSATGRFIITFNGEIYNFAEIRRALSSPPEFRGHSDTEVLLAAFEEWGVRRTLDRLRGMFAFAVFDTELRDLWLARDRLGIKPLYLLQRSGAVAWASEARAFQAFPLFDGRGDSLAARAYLERLYVPAPRSILSGVEKVLPGEVLRFRLRDGVDLRERERYWDLERVARSGSSGAGELQAEEVVDQLHELLRESVRLRLVSDVPLGAFLSGGVDSSTVVGIMQELSDRPVRTFTISFDDPAFDEGPVAEDISRHLGTDHTSVRFTDREVMEMVPRMAMFSDEPMANPSLLPTLLVSQVARRDVVVALSGDGGDELFGGYNRYLHGANLIRRMMRLPTGLRRPLAGLLASRGAQRMVGAALDIARPSNVGQQHSQIERLKKVSRMAAASGSQGAYEALLRVGFTQHHGVDLEHPGDVFRRLEGDLESRMMLLDQLDYLPGDLLAKVDRASMWASLEARVPILDHRVVEFSWRIPTSLKIRDGQTKYPLREIARRYLPASILDRPKMGFTVPVARWLRGGLRDWTEDRLRSAQDGLAACCDTARIAGMWTEFDQKGRDDLALPLWTVAVLEAWRREWGVEFS